MERAGIFVVNPPVLISALLLSASPAVAQFDRDNNCIRNKESEMHRIERLYQTAYQEVLNHENMPLFTRQMEEAGRISKDLSQAEKNGTVETCCQVRSEFSTMEE